MSEKLQIKGLAFSSFAILDIVKKLQDHKGYLIWKREMTKILKMIELGPISSNPTSLKVSQQEKHYGLNATRRLATYLDT